MKPPGVRQSSRPRHPMGLPWTSTTTRAGAWETPLVYRPGLHHMEDKAIQIQHLPPLSPQQHHPHRQEDR